MVAELFGPVAVYWPFLLIAAIIISTVELVKRWQGWDDQIKEEPRTRSSYIWDALFTVFMGALCIQSIYGELHKPTIAWIFLAFLILVGFLLIIRAVRLLLKARQLSV